MTQGVWAQRAPVLPNYTDLQTLTILREVQEMTLNLSECQKCNLKFKGQGNTLNRVIRTEGKRGACGAGEPDSTVRSQSWSPGTGQGSQTPQSVRSQSRSQGTGQGSQTRRSGARAGARGRGSKGPGGRAGRSGHRAHQPGSPPPGACRGTDGHGQRRFCSALVQEMLQCRRPERAEAAVPARSPRLQRLSLCAVPFRRGPSTLGTF